MNKKSRDEYNKSTTRNRRGSIAIETLFVAIVIAIVGFKINAKLFSQGVIGIFLLLVIADTVSQQYNSRKNKDR